jgi:Replication-relaxation
VLRLVLWRMLGLCSTLLAIGLLAWLLDGGLGRALRGAGHGGLGVELPGVVGGLGGGVREAATVLPAGLVLFLVPLVLVLLSAVGIFGVLRLQARKDRNYVRLRVLPYRTDVADEHALARMFAALQARLLRRWWERLRCGQPSVGLEVHHQPSRRGEAALVWLGVTCLAGQEATVEAALQVAYPNMRLVSCADRPGSPPCVLRLKKHRPFVERVTGGIERFEREPEPLMDRLMTAMAATTEPAIVQLALTPAPVALEGLARWLYKRREASVSRARGEGPGRLERSLLEDVELRGALELQHRPLFFADIRVIGPGRSTCEQIASVLRSQRAENRLVERTTSFRQGAFGRYTRRVQRGEGNPVPGLLRGVFATNELAGLWQLPSIGYTRTPFSRTGLPLAPASPEIFRPTDGPGTLRDALGPVSIHVAMRRQNTAVPGTVEQGKSSFLVASMAEDLLRDRCAVIVLDPKGDAADAALSAVPEHRACTLLDFAHPTCGFNPLAVDAPPDVIADYAVAALKNLFTDADIRASSDRYLRNAIIAVLAYDRRCSLWDAARLLSVGEEGYAYRSLVGSTVRALPELKEISQFFTSELSAQLADARSATTSKLDAPVNKLARLLNSASIKRVLLNESLRVDLDRVIAGAEVLIVKGALGSMGAGNTSVLMQLLVGMLDAALARQQDLVAAEDRIAIALKIDEAPLVLNRGFAETMALKRSAGLETVACWQTDAQWADREVRDQLDGLFAHRVYFATASAPDARAAAALTMAEFSDTVRPETGRLSTLGRPDVRLRLPKHHAIASWTTPEGRQGAFIAQTLPMRVDPVRLEHHARAQRDRGARHLTDLRQPHWQESRPDHKDQVPGASPTPVLPDRGSGPSGVAEAAMSALPAKPAEGYRELAAIDEALSFRRVRQGGRAEHALESLDLEILLLVAELGHLLSSQIHRRFNPQRAATTTQRRLKRLADGGLVDRFQFHRGDGGGVPMCYVISAAGCRVLQEHGHELGNAQGEQLGPIAASQDERTDGRLSQARHQLHVAAWALALSSLVGAPPPQLWGPGRSMLQPPRSNGPARAPLSPAELTLPGGRVPHDFLHRLRSGELVEAGRFESLRPDAVIGLRGADGGQGLDILLERDDRIAAEGWLSKLERYDHFLAGWSAHTSRYGANARAAALAVFICRDRPRARAAARRADGFLRASRAYAGEYPSSWEYPGRDRILFAAERDIHEGRLDSYGVPELPPHARTVTQHGDPSAAEAEAVVRAIALPNATPSQPAQNGGALQRSR